MQGLADPGDLKSKDLSPVVVLRDQLVVSEPTVVGLLGDILFQLRMLNDNLIEISNVT